MKEYPRYIYSATEERLVYSEEEAVSLGAGWFDTKLEASEGVTQPELEKHSENADETLENDNSAEPTVVKRKRGPNKPKA